MIFDFLKEIEQHFEKEYPREGCGLLCVKQGRMHWVPCTNVAKDEEDFVIDSTEYLKAHRTSDIVGIVHSHPDASCEPSEADRAYCNVLGIRYYIYSYPEMDLCILDPEGARMDLYGREYKFGVTDCFEAARDYLKSVEIEIPPRIAFEDDWWDKDLDYFTDEMLAEWGFEPVDLENAQKNDVIVFNVRAPVGNHCGVYLGGDAFYHHAVDRLSCRESLYPFWVQHIKRVYRYVA
jgi:proteasome lid subunit RPN8/RPN11